MATVIIKRKGQDLSPQHVSLWQEGFFWLIVFFFFFPNFVFLFLYFLAASGITVL